MANWIIDANKRKSQINKNIYGHFSEHLGRCIYEGIYVGEDSPIPNKNGMRTDVVEALKAIKVPVLRWPGGCFADEYHWMDGIGEKSKRKKMINTHWGGVVEDNSFGTHEFMELCQQVGCDPYINGNVGSGTVKEMSEWVEYLTFEGVSPMAALRSENGQEAPWTVNYFGVGNENWGCGGNMRPEYYADLYRQYQTYLRNYGSNKIFRIACGANSDDYNWTKVLMENAGRFMDGLSIHYYTLPNDSWIDKGPATDFSEEDYYKTLAKTFKMEELIDKHSHIMDQYDPEKRVAMIVDEWGSWYNVEPGTNPGFLYQQNTMRDAMIAAINLTLFNKHSDRVKMANIAQMVNVLQAIILTEGDRLVLTPTYHVFDLFKVHMNNYLLDSSLLTQNIGNSEMPVQDLYESVSIDEQGSIHMTIANIHVNEARELVGSFSGFVPVGFTGQILKGAFNAYNDFETPNTLKLEAFEAVSFDKEIFKFTLPPCSVVRLTWN